MKADVLSSRWPRTTLGDLCRMYQPETITKKSMKPDGAYPVFGANGIMGRHDRFNHDEPQLVIGCRGACGSVHITEPKSWITGNSMVIQPLGDEVDLNYLRYFFEGPADLPLVVTGAAQPQITQTSLKRIVVPLPPLEEQKRIVVVLDQAFAVLDRARALAEANLADAEELFVRRVDELFGLNAGSPMTTIGEVANIQSGAGFPNKDQGRTSGKYPFYKVSDMNLEGNEWSLNRANNYIDEPVRKRLRAAIFPKGSIVFPKVGGAIATNKKRVIAAEGCVDNNVMGLIPDEESVVPAYLHEWLYATDIYEFSNKANPPSITQGTVKGWPFPCPDKSKQLRTVELVVELREAVTNVTGNYKNALTDLAELRQSLLQKAFAGELT